MLVLEIKKYIKSKIHVSVSDISTRFEVSESHARFLLLKFAKKGMLKHFKPEALCRSGSCGCSTCSIESLETFSWLEK